MRLEVKGEDYTLKNTFGEINFTVDEDGISVFGVFVSKKRRGIGTSLVKELEKFALANELQRIYVPATPSREAITFWLKLGYHYVSPEDKIIGDDLMKYEDPECIIETESGIILLKKDI